jgi:hypothetical protein
MAKPRVHKIIARKLRTVPTAKANMETYAFPSFDPRVRARNRTILEVARATTNLPSQLRWNMAETLISKHQVMDSSYLRLGRKEHLPRLRR